MRTPDTGWLVASHVALALTVAACQVHGTAPAQPVATPPPERQAALERHVRALAEDIGPRCGATSVTYDNLTRARDYVHDAFAMLKQQTPGSALRLQSYQVHGRTYDNVEYELAGAGRAEEIIVVGAHYDSDCGESRPFTPGADDNASGVAALLELASLLSKLEPPQRAALHRSVRFVAFTNEEEPYFHTDDMGSLVYARACAAEGLRVNAMLSLEMLGYYTPKQEYPWYIRWLPGLPEDGNFLAIAGNPSSSCLVSRLVDAVTRNSAMTVRGIVAPGVSLMTWSDQWSFWRAGYPAVMVTDTSKLRNANYHTQGDTPCTLKYVRMAEAVEGLAAAVRDLAYDPPPPPPATCTKASVEPTRAPAEVTP